MSRTFWPCGLQVAYSWEHARCILGSNGCSSITKQKTFSDLIYATYHVVVDCLLSRKRICSFSLKILCTHTCVLLLFVVRDAHHSADFALTKVLPLHLIRPLPGMF